MFVEVSVVLLYLLRKLARVARGKAAQCGLRRIFLRVKYVLYRFRGLQAAIHLRADTRQTVPVQHQAGTVRCDCIFEAQGLFENWEILVR
jgi:hypothetical protein